MTQVWFFFGDDEFLKNFSFIFNFLLFQDKVFQEKDVLLAFLSHEIRNPVQAIISGSEELIRLEEAREEMEKEEEGEGSRDPGELHLSDIARDVYMAADLLHAVVNETIDFVQISSRNFVAKHEVLDLFHFNGYSKNINLFIFFLVSPGIRPPRVLTHLQQCIYNLQSGMRLFSPSQHRPSHPQV